MVELNGKIFYNGSFRNGTIYISDGKIKDIVFEETKNSNNSSSERFIIPGLVDIHTHGCVGYDFSSADSDQIHKMRRYYLKNGITSILATTVSLADNDLKKATETIRSASELINDETTIEGINIEGPYLSPKKCGAHDISLLKNPDIDFINSLGSEIKIVNVAPEYENASEFIKKFSGKVSIAHTDCNYETAMKAISLGADHITHIFNAMNGLHHRFPGVIGAFFDTDAFAEMICDGIHIHESILRMMFKAKAENIAIISDSMAATGLKDGAYKLGGLDVNVTKSVATLADGTLAGSVMNIYEMMLNLIRIGVPKEKAIESATIIPASSINMSDKIGCIDIGRQADLVITDDSFRIINVVHGGIIY